MYYEIWLTLLLVSLAFSAPNTLAKTIIKRKMER